MCNWGCVKVIPSKRNNTGGAEAGKHDWFWEKSQSSSLAGARHTRNMKEWGRMEGIIGAVLMGKGLARNVVQGPGLCPQESTLRPGARAPSLQPARALCPYPEAFFPASSRGQGPLPCPHSCPLCKLLGTASIVQDSPLLSLNRPTRPQRRRTVAIFPVSWSPRCIPGRLASWEGEFLVPGGAGRR